jgi:hypothetical protein
MRPKFLAFTFLATVVASSALALGGYSLDRGIYIGSHVFVDNRDRDRVLKRAKEELERKRAEHVETTAEEEFSDLPKRSFVKVCSYLFASGVHPSFGGSYSEGDDKPPCRLFER